MTIQNPIFRREEPIMRITVKRDSGLINTASKFQLMVDGEKVEKIKNNETIDLEIPKETATVKVSQYDTKTNEVAVTDGDKLLITSTSFGTNSRLLLIIAFIVVVVAQNVLIQLAGVIAGLIIFGVVSFGKKPNYKLEKISQFE